MRRSVMLVVLSGVIVATAGCGAAERPGGMAWQAVYDTIGDTIVVRTVAGSIWGEPAELVPEVRIGVFDGAEEYIFGNLIGLAVADDGSIYAFDRQALALRKYSPDGVYLATFGREGAGPGEYRGPDSGLAVLPDGRIALRDPANARITLYSPEGESVGNWPARGGLQTSLPLYVDTAGTVATAILLDPDADVGEWRTGLARIHADGTLGDTIAEPTYGYKAPRITAERQQGTSTMFNSDYVPFSPTTRWALSPYGYLVAGVSTRYAIDLFRTDAPHLRIERVHEPVAVQAGEKSDVERRATARMRNVDPSWRWNGPPIPDHKPPFQGIFLARDGRIWVQLYQPGYRVAVEEEESDEPGRIPAARWREPVAFDVFEADGQYLGEVRAPEGFSTYPTPVIRGDQVWAVVRDEMDVQYITRFRVARSRGAE